MAGNWKIDFKELVFERRIGKGSFGEVWKGKYLQMDVAIKKLFFVDETYMHKYIEREMRTLMELFHPHIVQLIGLAGEKGTNNVYIVTEFVAGGNLKELLKNRDIPLSWSRRIGFARDVALAMTYLHHKDIMHRDLKSANMLIGPEWRILLCDFGLSREVPEEDEEHLITAVGTTRWMAPEVALNDPYDKSADVFSFAMVLFELITRDRPPKRILPEGYAFKPEKFEAVIPVDTPRELWHLLIKCSSLNPVDRPTFKELVTILTELEEKAREQEKAVQAMEDHNNVTNHYDDEFNSVVDEPNSETPRTPPESPSSRSARGRSPSSSSPRKISLRLRKKKRERLQTSTGSASTSTTATLERSASTPLSTAAKKQLSTRRRENTIDSPSLHLSSSSPAAADPAAGKKTAPKSMGDIEAGKKEQHEKNENSEDDVEDEDDEEESEEGRGSLIIKGREVTEVTKVIHKGLTRTRETIRFKCSIERKDRWHAEEQVAIKVTIANDSHKAVNLMRVYLQANTTVTSKKTRKIKGKARAYLEEGLPVRQGKTFKKTLSFDLPSKRFLHPSSTSCTNELVVDFRIKRASPVKCYLPLVISDS